MKSLQMLRRVGWGVLGAMALLVLVGWVRSYIASDDVWRVWSVAWSEAHPTDSTQKVVHEARGQWVVSSALGSLALWEMRDERVYAPMDPPIPEPHEFGVKWHWSVEKPRLVYNDALGWQGRWGFMYYEESYPLSAERVIPSLWPRALKQGEFMREWIVSYWVLMVVAGLPWVAPAVRFARKRQRAKAGHCAGCGYDLRMHSAGERCPECGRMIPPPPPHSETPGGGGK